MDKKLLIAGIDPGITVGYALIDLNGEVVSIGSEKHLDLDSLVSKVIKFGRILVVGTDKAKTPAFVEKFAGAVGAKIVSPAEDMKSSEKADLVRGLGADDDHQLDALASAFLAMKRFSALLKKINEYIKTYDKQKIADKLTQIVVLNGISIREAADLLEKPDKEESKIISKVVEKRKLEEKDFLKLYSKLNQIEKENFLLRRQSRKLKEEISNLEKPREKKKPYEKTFNKLLRQREKRFFVLERELSSKDTDIDLLNAEMDKLCYFLSTLGRNILLKKLSNLGNIEFEKKAKLLNLSKDDILLVDDPNIISDKAIEKIKNKVQVIVCNNKPGRKVSSLPFIFIDAKKLDIEENQYFAVTDKQAFEKEKGKLDILSKVVEDYKNERLG